MKVQYEQDKIIFKPENEIEAGYLKRLITGTVYVQYDPSDCGKVMKAEVNLGG